MSRIKGDNKKSLQCTVYSTVKISETEDSDLISYNINELERLNDWIDIETTVNLLSLSRQTIQKRIKQNCIQSIKVTKPNGGLKTFINVNIKITFNQFF